jgi:ArsR family transcriptional regulator
MDMSLQEKKALILKGIAHPVRMAIVETLSEGELCVCDITEKFSCDRTTISKHLALLKDLGILGCRKEGLHVYYRLDMKCLATLLDCIEMVASGKEPEATAISCRCSDQ